MKKKPRKGFCAICGLECELTFEHIPPRAAFNDKPSRMYSMENILEKTKDSKQIPKSFEGLHYSDRQKGYGDYLLCAKCNNMTGHLYAPAYINFNNSILKLIADNYDDYMKASGLQLNARIEPLNFSKQVLSMFCCSYPKIKEQYPIIQKLILDKNTSIQGDNCPFQLLMFLLTPDSIPGSTGPIALLMDDGRIDAKFEIDFPPLGFQIYESKTNNNAMDITPFLSFKYNETADINSLLPIYKKDTILPVKTLEALR